MTSEDRFGLRPLWDALLGIYGEIAKICQRHGLRCYVTDGTALGAVRHKGFIPWDDDFDVSMPRPDYELFRKLAAKELPPHLRFIDYRNAPGFETLFGKVLDTRRDVVEGMEKKVNCVLSGGIGIDIFPIEGFPSNRIKWLLVRFSYLFVYYRLVFWGARFRGESFKGKVYYIYEKVSALLTPWMRAKKDLLRGLERLAMLSEFDASEYTVRTCSQRSIFRRAPLKKLAWGRPTPAEFDDTVVMVPEDCDAHLRNEYFKWDYHELPPASEQHPTHSYDGHCEWWLGPAKGQMEI